MNNNTEVIEKMMLDANYETTVKIISSEECSDKLDVTIFLNYNGVEYCGKGHDYLWIDAFADLQTKLPNGVVLKCCLTCRHGNLCPVGNKPGEVFCTKDVTIKSKNDLTYFTEDYEQRDSRSRKYTNICESYVHQNEEYYTYNDYLYQLEVNKMQRQNKLD